MKCPDINNSGVVKELKDNAYNHYKNMQEGEVLSAVVENILTPQINDIQKRALDLKKSIGNLKANKGNETRILELEQVRKDLKTEFKLLKNKKTKADFVAQGLKDLEKVNSILSKDGLSAGELVFIQSTTKFYTDNDIVFGEYSVLTPSDIELRTPDYEKISFINSEMNSASVKARQITEAFLIADSFKDFDVGIDMSTVGKKTKGAFGITRDYSLDLSKSDNDLVSYLGNKQSRAFSKAQLKTNTKVDSFFKLYESVVNKHGKESINKLFAKNAKGEYTGEFVNKATPKYWAKRNKNLKKKNDSPAEYEKWSKENQIIVDMRKLFYEKYKEINLMDSESFTKDEIENHRKEIIENFKDDSIFDIINDKFERYLKNRELFLEDETDPIKIQQWEAKYSPFYNTSFVNYREIDGLRVYAEGWKYGYEIPKRIINGVDSGYYSADYEDVQNNQELRDLHEFITETMHDAQQATSYQYGDKLRINTVPVVQKRLFEMLSADTLGTVKDNWKGFKDSFFVGESEEFQSDTLKLGMLNKIPIEKMSFQLERIMPLFIKEVELFRAKAEIDDIQRLGRQLLKDKLGDGATVVKALDNALDHFYGNKTGNPILIGKIDVDKVEAFKSFLISGQDKFIYEGVEYDKETARKELENISKQFSVTAALEASMKYMHVKAMGWNVFSAITNFGFGAISNLTEASAGEHFNIKTMNESYILLLNSLGRATSFQMINTTAGKKIANTLIRHNAIDTTDEFFNMKMQDFMNKTGVVMPYGFTQSVEFVNQGVTFIAQAKFKKIKLKNSDKTISLWDAFNEDGSIDYDLYDFTENDLVNFLEQHKDVRSRLHGNYDPSMPILAKRNQLGRMLLMFRTWFPESVESRFGSKRYSRRLGHHVEGYYTTTAKTFKKEGFIGLISEIQKALTRKSELTQYEQANLRRMFTEASTLLAITVFAMILKSSLDDEDDPDVKFGMLYAMNVAFRLQNDIELYINPVAFQEIFKSNIPAFQLSVDLQRFFNNSIDYIMDDSEKNAKKLNRSTHKLFPGTASYIRQLSAGEREE